MVLALMLLTAIQQSANPIDRDRLDRSVPPPPVGQQFAKGAVRIDAEGNARPIRGIAFQGTDAPPEVAKAAESFLGKPNTSRTLAELVAALSDAYGKSRVAFFTIAVPKQNFADDVVVVSLTEAGIEDVNVQGRGEFSRLRGLARPMVGRRPVPRSLYERQVVLMRAIPGLTVDLGVANPDNDEDLTLVLKARQKRVEVAAGINNRGPDLVGDMLVDGRIDFYGLISDGDRLRIGGSASTKPRRYRQAGASYETPIGLSGLAASASVAWVRTSVARYSLSGDAQIASLGLTYPVLRSFRRSAELAISLDGVNSHNAAFGNAFSSDSTRAVRAGGSYAAAGDHSTVQASMILSQGLSTLGARVNPMLTDKSFRKANATVALEYRFGKRLLARGTVLGQWSNDRLPAAELFAVGGPTIGRAFDTGFLSGDRGAGGVAELAVRPMAAGRFAKSEVYGYIDGATLRRLRRGPFVAQGFSLASVGAGVRTRWNDKVELGVEAGRVLERPYPGYDEKWRLSFSYRLTM